MSGRVHLVGAGPGDPDLLTVRAERLLRAADVVVHDRLVGPGVLALVPSGTRLIDVGKTGYGAAADQDEVNELLIRLAQDGSDVVRLKGGDPFVFGRGGEELLALRAAGVAVDVVPGITAGIAAPASIGVPVTHRGVARSVAFVAGHAASHPADDDDEEATPNWTALASIDTLVVYMAGRTGCDVARHLIAAGRAAVTPAAIILDATLDTQEVHLADLAALAADCGPETAGRAAILVIGEVVRLGRPASDVLALASSSAP